MRVNPDNLKRFYPFQDMSRDQLQIVSETLDVMEARTGEVLIKRGSDDPDHYFLLEGKVIREAEDGKINLLSADDPSASKPLSQLIPHQYQVTSATRIRYICVPQNLMGQLSEAEAVSGIVVDTLSDGASPDTEHSLILKFLEDLEQNRLFLPSLPDVAIRIGTALGKEDTDAEQIGRMVQTDPAISAKLIKAANSAMYRTVSPAETVSQAIIRIGFKTTQQLVISFALREIFKTDSKRLNDRMMELWQHSILVAALCRVIAIKTGQFDPEEAMLAGLVHDIGTVTILNNLKSFPEIEAEPSMIDMYVDRLRAQTGQLLLQKWGFPEALSQAAFKAEDWFKNDTPQADYGDLVIIAQLHAMIGNEKGMDLPGITEAPAFEKLNLEELTPSQSEELLNQAEELVEEYQGLFD